MKYKLSVKNLKKFYNTPDGKLQTLDDFCFDIKDGEFITIVGPNGCGKTTLLKIISGLIQPTEGEILIDEKIIVGTDPRIGIVFQECSLLPWRTVIGNVAFGLEIRGYPSDKRLKIASGYIKNLRLEKHKNFFPTQLSGGIKQKVSLAQVLALNPQILLMDEPFGALDAQTRESLQKEILKIWKNTKKTIIFVTHSVEEAVYLANRIIIMTKRPGSVKEIVKIPKHMDKKDFRSSFLFYKICSHIRKTIKEEIIYDKY